MLYHAIPSNNEFFGFIMALHWIYNGQPPKQWKDQEGGTITVAAALGPSNFGRPLSTTPHTTHSWKSRLYEGETVRMVGTAEPAWKPEGSS